MHNEVGTCAEILPRNSPKIRTVDLRYYLFRNGGRKNSQISFRIDLQ